MCSDDFWEASSTKPLVSIPCNIIAGVLIYGSIVRLIDNEPCSMPISITSLIMNCLLFMVTLSLWCLVAEVDDDDTDGGNIVSCFGNCCLNFFGIGLVLMIVGHAVLLSITLYRGEKCSPLGWFIADWAVCSLPLIICLVSAIKTWWENQNDRPYKRTNTSDTVTTNSSNRPKGDREKIFRALYESEEDLQLVVEENRNFIQECPLSEKEIVLIKRHLLNKKDERVVGQENKQTDQCVVCVNPTMPHEEILTFPGCNHLYHLRCVPPFWKNLLACEECKQLLRPQLAKLVRASRSLSTHIQSQDQPQDTTTKLDGNSSFV